MELLGIYTRMSSRAAYHVNPLFTRVPRVAHVKCRAGIVVCRTRRPPAAPPTPPPPPPPPCLKRKPLCHRLQWTVENKGLRTSFCVRAIKYVKPALSLMRQTRDTRAKLTHGDLKPLRRRRAAFSLSSNAALNARSPTVSAARLRPPAVYNHRPPLSLCHRELSSSLPGPPPPPLPPPSSCGTL